MRILRGPSRAGAHLVRIESPFSIEKPDNDDRPNGRIRQFRQLIAAFKGDSMYRRVTFITCLALILFTGVLQAQGQFTIHAASAEPVAAWQKMDAGDKSVWVNPTPALTSADLERAIPERGPEGR